MEIKLRDCKNNILAVRAAQEWLKKSEESRKRSMFWTFIHFETTDVDYYVKETKKGNVIVQEFEHKKERFIF